MYKWLIFCILLASLFAILLWDMTRMSSLSRVIHDDHSSLWKTIRKTKLIKWLTPLDVCILSNPYGFNVSAYHYATTNCSKLLPRRKDQSNQTLLFCSIGLGLGRTCVAPHLERSYFDKETIGAVTGNTTRYNIKSAMRQLVKFKKSLIFVGDSLTRQSVQALFCEIMRLEPSVQLRGDLMNPHNVTATWPAKDSRQRSSLSIHYIQYTGNPHNHVIEGGADAPGQPARDGGGNIHTPDHPSHIDLAELKARVSAIEEQSVGGVVLVLNIGAAYMSRMKFRDDIREVLDWMDRLGSGGEGGKNSLALFRETAAQHWNHTSYGYRSSEVSSDTPSQCVPLEDNSAVLDWRNQEVRSYIQLSELNHVHILPFRDLTTALYDMHISNPLDIGDVDCYQFCYFPQLWVAVYSSLSYSISVLSVLPAPQPPPSRPISPTSYLR
jgi:hypothetical protein